MQIIFLALFYYPLWGMALLWWFCRSSGPTRDVRMRGLFALCVAAAAAIAFTPATFGTEGSAFFVPWWIRLLDRQHTLLIPWAGSVVFLVAIAINWFTGSTAPKQLPPPAQRRPDDARSHLMREGLVRPAPGVDEHSTADETRS
ncbi:hypothetical protein [Roseateles sp. L2-2]|uniref:hypothetical protein n=1 Tax=Roseateles TaxID=93681 RepID=UPI003D362F4B